MNTTPWWAVRERERRRHHQLTRLATALTSLDHAKEPTDADDG
jgi:hypothetical protein